MDAIPELPECCFCFKIGASRRTAADRKPIQTPRSEICRAPTGNSIDADTMRRLDEYLASGEPLSWVAEMAAKHLGLRQEAILARIASNAQASLEDGSDRRRAEIDAMIRRHRRRNPTASIRAMSLRFDLSRAKVAASLERLQQADCPGG